MITNTKFSSWDFLGLLCSAVLLAYFLFFVIPAARSDVSVNLVSYWNFNDGTSSTTPVTAADSVGANTGTLMNGAFWTNDKSEQPYRAMQFDGGSTIAWT